MARPHLWLCLKGKIRGALDLYFPFIEQNYRIGQVVVLS